MAAFIKIDQFVEDLCAGVHNLASDNLTIALCATADTIVVATDAVLADLSQIVYTDCSSRLCVPTSCDETAGTAKLIIPDLVLTSTGTVGPFQWVVLYNATPVAGPLIGYYNYGSALTLGNGETFTINFDGAAGVLTVA